MCPPFEAMMDLITKLPLARLTTSSGEARRIGNLDADAIRDLLRAGPVRFVLADVGAPLRWTPEKECFDLWKNDVRPHLADPSRPAQLDHFPGGYAYFASYSDSSDADNFRASKSGMFFGSPSTASTFSRATTCRIACFAAVRTSGT